MSLPPKRSSSKSTPNKKRKPKPPPSSLMPVALGGLVALLVLVVGGLWWMGIFNGKAKPAVAVQEPPPAVPSDRVDLSWLPPETEMVVHARLAELWKAPLLAPLLNSPAVSSALFPLQEKLQITPADIESITLGLPEGQSMIMAAAMAVSASTNPLEGRPYALVIRYHKPVSEAAFTSVESSLVQHGGKSIHLLKMSGRDGLETAVYAVTPQMHLVADLNSVKAAIDRGPGDAVRPAFALLSAKDQLGLAFVPRDSALLRVPDQPDTPDWAKPLQKVFGEAGQGVGVGLQVADGVTLRLSFGAKSKEGTQQIKTAADQAVQGLKAAYQSNKEMLAFFVPPTGLELIELLASNLQGGADESLSFASITTSIPPSAKSKLEQLPSMVMDQFFRAVEEKSSQPEMLESPAEPSPGIAPEADANSEQVRHMAVSRVDNLPDGVQLTGTIEARLATPPDTGMRFRLSVLATGLPQTSLIAGQSLRFTEVELDDHSAAKILRQGDDSTFHQYDLWQMKPDSVMSLGNTVCTTPRVDVKSLKRAKATVQLMTAEFIKPISIQDLPSFAKKQEIGPALKEAGFMIESQPDATDPAAKSYIFRFNPGYGMRFLRALDAAGTLLIFHRQVQFEQGRFTEVMSDANLPEQFRLPAAFNIQFGLCRNVKVSEMTVQFADIPTPPLSK